MYINEVLLCYCFHRKFLSNRIHHLIACIQILLSSIDTRPYNIPHPRTVRSVEEDK